MSEELTKRFHSSQTIRRILIVLLWITIVLAPFALALGYVERNVLHGIENLSFPSNEEMIAAAEASDRNIVIMGIIQVIVFLAATIVWFMWIYRSNKLARALGASAMTYSPGWSVGWFFIPIANLFKPYFAMKQIYLATMDPKSFDTEQEVEDQPESLNILKLWWLVYLVDAYLGRIALRYALRADTVEELVTANSLMLASDAATVVASLATIWLVREFTQKQEIAFAAAQSGSEPQATPA
jgi:heme/copper-type cytochrome/quinol oxidase subunit 2